MIPVAVLCISPAWGAARFSLPMPPPDWCKSRMMGTSTRAAATTPKSPPICIFQGVPPSRCPTFQSWSMSPATPATQQTTVATPSTAMMPEVPFMPSSTSRPAEMSKVDRVSPEMGLDEEPMMPTR